MLKVCGLATLRGRRSPNGTYLVSKSRPAYRRWLVNVCIGSWYRSLPYRVTCRNWRNGLPQSLYRWDRSRSTGPEGHNTDILHAIESNEFLSNWKVVATSRDQGLEAYRAWFPTTFYRGAGIGDVTVRPFSDEEAEILATEKPHLRRVLFGTPSVKEIARRPFFAASACP